MSETANTITMFKTRGFDDYIQEVKVSRYTESYVFFFKESNRKEFKASRVSQYDNFHVTKEDAISFLVKKYNDRIEYTTKQIEKAKNGLLELEKVYGLI
jgi:hypothetical protein